MTPQEFLDAYIEDREVALKELDRLLDGRCCPGDTYSGDTYKGAPSIGSFGLRIIFDDREEVIDL